MTTTQRGWLVGQSFAERLMILKGDDSFETLADKMNKAGVNVTRQALFKWADGGGISVENMLAVAKFFRVAPGALFFGDTGAMDGRMPPEAQLIAKAFTLIPPKLRREVTGDLLRVALAYADKEEPEFRASIKAMLDGK